MVFLSYSRRDQELVQLMSSGLRSRGIKVWLDTSSGPGGEWEIQIGGAIRSSSNFVLLMSSHATSSAVVGREVSVALAASKNIVPVMAPGFSWLSPTPKADWVQEVQRFNAVPVSLDYTEAFLDKLAHHCIGEKQRALNRWLRKLLGQSAA